MECEADPLSLLLISKDFYIPVKCPWNADLACRWCLFFFLSFFPSFSLSLCLPDFVPFFPSFPSLSFPLHACMLSRFSHVRLFATLWTIAHQTRLSMALCPGKKTGMSCRSHSPGFFPFSFLFKEACFCLWSLDVYKSVPQIR